MEATATVAVVTGASSGIGRASAVRFAEAGYHVVLVARRRAELERTLEQCGGRGRVAVVDVADRAQVRALAASVKQVERRCDVLVNCAGIGGRGAFEGPEQLDLLERVMQVNFFGAAYAIAELLPLLKAAAPGSAIVNVSSVAGLFGTPGSPIYCASKFALNGLGESLHFALGTKGIHVANVLPGPVPTEGFPHARLVSTWLGRRMASDVDAVAELILRSARPGARPMRIKPRLYSLLLGTRVVAPPLYRALLRRAAPKVQQPHHLADDPQPSRVAQRSA